MSALEQTAETVAADLLPKVRAGYQFADGDIQTACDMHTHGNLSAGDLNRLTVAVLNRLRRAQSHQ